MNHLEMLERTAKIVLKEQIGRIKDAPSDSLIVKANQHLFDGNLDAGGFGVGAGLLTCAGAIYYVLDCTLAVTGTYSCAVSFNAHGVSWDIGAFTAPVAGTFLVNPAEIAGACYFILVAADVAEGAVSFSLFSEHHGTLYGTFVGITEGLDLADMSGKGTLSVS